MATQGLASIGVALFLERADLQTLIARPVGLAATRAGTGEPPAAPIRLRLRPRVLLALFTVTVFTAALVGAALTDIDDRAGRLIAALAIAMAITVTIGLVHIRAITASILDPVEELAAATRRVEAGDFSGTVSVVSANELGELSRSFNRMVARLRERARFTPRSGATPTKAEPTALYAVS